MCAVILNEILLIIYFSSYGFIPNFPLGHYRPFGQYFPIAKPLVLGEVRRAF